MAGEHEKLDRLLAELASHPVVAGLQERAEDAGHLSDELLAELRAGRLDAAASRNLRRHILFCPACSALLMNRAATAEEKAVVPAEPDRAAPLAASPSGQGSRPTLRPLPVAAGAVLIVLLAAGLAWIVHRSTGGGDAAGAGAWSFAFRSVVGIAADGTVNEEGVRASDREIALALSLGETKPAHLYVVLVAPDRSLRMLHPAAGARSVARACRDLVWLPDPEAGEAAPRRGFTLDGVDRRPGECLSLLIFVAGERLAIFEDETVVEATLPRLAADHLPPAERLGREHLIDFGRHLRAARLADAFEQIIVELVD